MTKLEEVKQVVKTRSVEEVNNFLAKGFILKKEYSEKYHDAEGRENICPCWILHLYPK